MKLRTRLYALIAATLVPMVVVAGLAAYQTQETMKAAALQGIKESAKATALIIDREITAALTSVKVLASSPTIADRDWKRFYDLAVNASKASGGWVVLYEKDGKQVVNTRLPYGSPLGSRTVSIKISEILKHDFPQVSGMVWSPPLNRYVILVDLPIRLADRREYVLSQAFFPEHFNAAVTERNASKTWVIGVFDKAGITIARSVRANEFVGKPARPDTYKAMSAGHDVALRHVIRGDIEVYDVITHSALSGWAVAVGIPVAEIDGILNRAGLFALSGLLVALFVAIGVAAYIARGFSRSIKASARSATALGHGDPVYLPRPTGISELDVLQQAIYDAGQTLVAAESGRRNAENKNAKLLKSEQEARVRADAENKRKDEFLAMLGHELRNPLSAITSASSMLKMKVGSPEAAMKMAALIQRQSDHLRNILDDLLDLSRVMYGKVILDSQVLDLEALVKNHIAVLVETGKLDNFAFSLKSEPVQIYGDATRVEQILSNVIENAIKYTPLGGSISVEVKVDDACALAVVKDAGVGIDPQLMPYIFDVFVQGDQALARTKGGMGVGLSLARKLVELHAGTIDVHCDGLGHGCTFYIRFPISAGSPKIINKQEKQSDRDEKYRILLVEDQDDGREMMAMFLSGMGHQVTAVSDGEQALNAALAMPDVVLSDIGLPEMDGYEFAKRLRSDPLTKHLKLVALSGYGLEEDKKKAKEAGFDYHLTKPLRERDFLDCLHSLFN